MSDLVAFLRARIDEDEQVARGATEEERPGLSGSRPLRGPALYEWGNDMAEGIGILRDRLLAEVQAKRTILDEATRYSPELEHGDNGEWAFDRVLRHLPYANHPDDRQEWRP